MVGEATVDRGGRFGLKHGFHPNAIAYVACVAFGWKPGLTFTTHQPMAFCPQSFRPRHGTDPCTVLTYSFFDIFKQWFCCCIFSDMVQGSVCDC